MSETHGHFLTVLHWPEAADRDALLNALSEVSGVGAPTLRLRLGQRLPAIVACLDERRARQTAAALAQHGGEAFVCSLDDLSRAGDALEISTMAVQNGLLEFTIGGGPVTSVPPATIRLLVRAQTREDIVESPRSAPRMNSLEAANPIARQAAAEFGAAKKRSTRTSEYLDVHLDTDIILRVDGSRMSFAILGDLRQYSAKANTDQVFTLLKHLAPDAISDDYFKLWKPPPECSRLRIGGRARPRAFNAFEFYSRWVSAMYKYLRA